MDEIVCAMSISLSGRYAALGKSAFNGVKLWEASVNERGGVFVPEADKKILLRLVHYDDSSDADETRKIYERLIEDDGADLLIGPYSSGLTLAAAEIANRYGRTLWNHGGSSDEIFKQGFPCLVSSITAASEYFHGILHMIRTIDKDSKSVALIYASDSGFSVNVASGAVKCADMLGFSTTQYQYSSGERAFGLLRDTMRREPDIILSVGRMDDDMALVKAALREGLTCKAFATIPASIDSFQAALGDMAEGFIGPSQWEPTLDYATDLGSRNSEFASKFERRYGEPPNYTAAQAYNIGLIVEACINKAGTLADEELRAAAKTLSLRTFYGDFEIDPATGAQTAHKMLALQWQKGRKVIVYPDDVAEGKLIYPHF